MVFLEEYGEHFDKLITCGTYHPYRRNGEKNPDFDVYSGLLLDLKENKTSAVERFTDYLEDKLDVDFAIAVVPSHDPAKTTSGLKNVAHKLAANDRIDATNCLIRVKRIDKLAHGGNRSIEIHLDTIKVQNKDLIEGRDVLLLDDIKTSGNSLRACKQLLVEAGAARVQMLAFGKTSQG